MLRNGHDTIMRMVRNGEQFESERSNALLTNNGKRLRYGHVHVSKLKESHDALVSDHLDKNKILELKLII